jgi:hypothetical protein
MTAAAKYPPSPWRPSPWDGGSGYREGFYVERTNNGTTEWFQTRTGRARQFASEAEALAAIARAAEGAQ